MSDTSGHRHHSIDYIELVARDLTKTRAFYAAAFGWTFNDYGPEYAGFVDGASGKEAGGFRVGDEIVRGGPLVVLYSDELDATHRRVREAGGEIVKDTFEFPGGRRFHFRDPSGNELAVWSTV